MRKVYLVPNIVTTANLFCGFYSIIAAIHLNFLIAAWAIIVAGVFDMLDGRIARLAKATSHFGVEYDSMSDLLSFGAAPALLIYLWVLEPVGRVGWMASFLFLTACAFRLARFNVTTSVLPKRFFQGLPTPVSAGILATFVIFFEATYLPPEPYTMPFSLFLVLGLAVLMISGVPFPSFKELNWRSKASFGYFLIGVGVLVLIAIRPEVSLFLLSSSYVIFSLLWNLWRLTRKTRVSLIASHESESRSHVR